MALRCQSYLEYKAQTWLIYYLLSITYIFTELVFVWNNNRHNPYCNPVLCGYGLLKLLGEFVDELFGNVPFVFLWTHPLTFFLSWEHAGWTSRCHPEHGVVSRVEDGRGWACADVELPEHTWTGHHWILWEIQINLLCLCAVKSFLQFHTHPPLCLYKLSNLLFVFWIFFVNWSKKDLSLIPHYFQFRLL